VRKRGGFGRLFFFAATIAVVSWTLYLLECVDGSLYAGITNDLARRFDLHAAGKGARYTRSHPPLRIVARQDFPDRSTASVAEYQLKRLDVAGKREFCRRHPYPG
jgi:putative endonuclease